MAKAEEIKSNLPTLTGVLSEKPRLDRYLREDASFQSTYIRALVAIASRDGYINLSEYSALLCLIESSSHSAISAQLVLSSIENPISLDSALQALSLTSAALSESERKKAWNAADALISAQGKLSRDTAVQLAKALKISVSEAELSRFPASSAPIRWKEVARRSTRWIKGRQLLRVADDCIRVTGDPVIADLIGQYLDGQIQAQALQTRVMAASSELTNLLLDFEQRVQDARSVETAADEYTATAHRLYEQVRQRLAMADARIQYEFRTFDQDMEEAIHDAGNSIELDMADRLRTDDWKLAKVWESIGRSSFAKELERRVDRIVRRREEALLLMKEDLRLFQEDLRLVQTQLLVRQHHTQFAKLMPRLGIVTRAANTVDTAAEVTLGAGVVSLAGTAAALHFLGAASVLPIIAPVAPFIGGAMLVAGIVKWISDSEERKTSEIKGKREVFESALRKELEKARESYFYQLEKLNQEFADTAIAIVTPTLLEAEAASGLNMRQVEVATKVLLEARTSLAKLNATIAEIR